MIEEINTKIAKRTSYGHRQVIVPDKEHTVLGWSNGAQKWIIYPNYANRSEKIADPTSGKKTITLDANMILVPFPEHKVKEVVDQLEDLPLYSNSVEAKMRGY